jgi:hypothetical protein
MKRIKPVLFFALSAFAVLMANDTMAADPPNQSRLTADEKKYLDELMTSFLFDPKGGKPVKVAVPIRSVWASSGEGTRFGWLVDGKGGNPAKVIFTDGAWIPAPPEKEITKVDFLAASKARYQALAEKKDDKKKDGPDIDEMFLKMQRTAVGMVDDDLVWAAWLYRLGHEELAARALAMARKGGGDPRKHLRDELAWSAFAGMVHAYMVRADEEALQSGERLLRLYPEEVKDKVYAQTPQIIDDLKRRQKKGTFGKAPPDNWPEDFEKWDTKKKTAFLIDALEEVDARQFSQPGDVALSWDRRVDALIRLGDPVIPELLDVLEKDERLTRSVHFWRDFGRHRTVLSVREAALTALMSILHVSFFETNSTSDSLTARGKEGVEEVAKKLRTYWNEYGKYPFDERMMKVLVDAKSSFTAKRDAARNLATINEERHLDTGSSSRLNNPESVKKSNDAIAKFRNPTAAEAILASMDADLKALDAKPAKERDEYEKNRAEEIYLSALVGLGDKRIGPEIAKRAAMTTVFAKRRQWAEAAHFLGEPKPFQAFAEEFRAGNMKIPDDDNRGVEYISPRYSSRELMEIVSSLSRVASPEADRALGALTDPRHPQHAAAARQIISEDVHFSGEHGWFGHPYCLKILRAELENKTLTGATFSIQGNQVARSAKNSHGSSSMPEFLADQSQRREQAEERTCDAAAQKLAELIIGVPDYHVLQSDCDQRLASLKKVVDHFHGHYCKANDRERKIFGIAHWSVAFLPDIRPLGRAATADDVKAGKAIFHLGGKGKLAEQMLPAVAIRKGDEMKAYPARVLIVQAEVGPDGQIIYGIIGRHEVGQIPASELTAIKTFADLEKEEKEAKEKKRN